MISKEAQKKIAQLILEYKLYLLYRSVGPQVLSRNQLKTLLQSTFASKLGRTQAPVIESYLATHEQVAVNLAPKDIRAGAIQFLERMNTRYVNKLADHIGADIQSVVEGNTFQAGRMPFIDSKEGAAVSEALQDPNLHSKNLRGILTGKVENWQYRYKTIVTTELNRASNWGAMDAILHNSPDQSPDQLYVFKQGNKPGHGACKHCEKFWYMADGITPKVYLMSQLIANGSNIGKKAKDWMPTIDATHPNESHILSELRPGFGFINGEIEWMSKDHNEYDKQQGKNPI